MGGAKLDLRDPEVALQREQTAAELSNLRQTAVNTAPASSGMGMRTLKCPKCGKPLNVYRLIQFANLKQEPFEFYLCHKHGFFLHDHRQTEAGL